MTDAGLPDIGPLWLSLQLAGITTLILLVAATPLAWWLAFTPSRWKTVIEAVTALPLVLPPTVLGFYLLVFLNPASPIGRFWVEMTGTTLTFSFAGLVVASLFYSLPFMVQPLQGAFAAVGRAPLEAAATLRASFHTPAPWKGICATRNAVPARSRAGSIGEKWSRRSIWRH